MRKVSLLFLSFVLIVGFCLPVQAKESITEQERAALKIFKKMNMYAGKNYQAFEALFYKADEDVVDEYFQQDYSCVKSDCVESKLMVQSGKTSIVNVVYYDNDNRQAPRFQALTIMLFKKGKKYYIDYRNSTVRRLNKEADKKGIFPKEYSKPETENIVHFDEFNYMYAFKDFYMKDCIYAQPAYIWQKKNGDVEMMGWINNGMNESYTYNQVAIYCEDVILGAVIDGIVDIDIRAKKKTSSTFRIVIPADKVKTENQSWTYLNAKIELSSNNDAPELTNV